MPVVRAQDFFGEDEPAQVMPAMDFFAEDEEQPVGAPLTELSKWGQTTPIVVDEGVLTSPREKIAPAVRRGGLVFPASTALDIRVPSGVYPGFEQKELRAASPSLPSSTSYKPERYLAKFHRRVKEATGLNAPPEPGPNARALLYPITAAFEALNAPINLYKGYEPGATGEGIGDVLFGAAAATAPFGKLGATSALSKAALKGGPLALGGLKGTRLAKGAEADLRSAIRAGKFTSIPPEALKEVGATKAITQQLKGRELLTAVQDYQGALREVAEGAKTSKQVFERVGIAKAAEEGVFGILKSLGVADDETAKVFIRHFAAEKAEPLRTLTKLLETPEKKLRKLQLAPNAIVNPFLPVRGPVRTKMTQGLEYFLLPETVMSLDQSALRVYRTTLDAQRGIEQARYGFKQTIDKAFKGLSHEQEKAVGHMLNGEDAGIPITAAMRKAFVRSRAVLETLAGPKWNDLKVKGKYLQDYLPGVFDKKRGDAPIDLLRTIAESQAIKANPEKPFASLSTAEQGKLLDGAYFLLKQQPRSYWFGNISRSRLPDTELVNFRAREVLHYYIDGAVRKAYMDRAYKSAQRLYPQIADMDIRNYTMDFVHGFRGLDLGKGRRVADTLRTMQAWAKLGLPNLTAPVQNASQNANTYAKVGLPIFTQAVRLRFSDEGRKLLQKSGVFLDVAKHEMNDAVEQTLQTGSGVLLSAFNWVERDLNRSIAWLAGYVQAKNAFPKASFAALNKAGRQMVDDTQFVFSSPGRPAAFRTPTGSVLGQFKLFGENQLRFIAGLKGPEVARFAMAVALMGGMEGIPGASKLVKAAAGVAAIQYIQDQDMPEVQKRLILGGVPRAVGEWAPQISQDVGVGFLPSDMNQLGRYLMSPTGSTLYGYAQGASGIANKDIEAMNKGLSEAVRSLPGGVGAERWRQAYETWKQGGTKLSPAGVPQREMTPAEIVQMGLWGGRSLSELEQQEKRQQLVEVNQSFDNAVKYLKYELHVGGAKGDAARVAKALAQARDAGVLQGAQLGPSFFEPVLLKQFLSSPLPVQEMLLDSASFRRDMEKEVQSLEGFAKRMGKTLKEGGAILKTIPKEEPTWSYKWREQGKKGKVVNASDFFEEEE